MLGRLPYQHPQRGARACETGMWRRGAVLGRLPYQHVSSRSTGGNCLSASVAAVLRFGPVSWLASLQNFGKFATASLRNFGTFLNVVGKFAKQSSKHGQIADFSRKQELWYKQSAIFDIEFYSASFREI